MSKKTPWLPPRGIRYSFRENRPRPFYLHWTDNDGREKTATYEDEAKRELAARDLADKKTVHGTNVLSFDPVRWAKYLEFQKFIGEESDPMVVAHEWRALKQGQPKAVSITVTDALVKYKRLRDDEKSWSVDFRRHATKHLSRFESMFGARQLHTISADDIRNWLFGTPKTDGSRAPGLKSEGGELLGAAALKDHRNSVNGFFQYSIREQWGAISNPCALVRRPKIADEDPSIISLHDAFHFFKANREAAVVGRVALEAFGGVRYTTAGLIQKPAINFDGRGVRMAAGIHKSGKKDGRTRYRQGHPDNLWEWLRIAPGACWTMTPLGYREAKRYAAIRAGIRPADVATDEDRKKMDALRNTWRHSFISAHLARFKNLPLTQYLAQHASSTQTEEYEGMFDEKDAARYFMITPQTVLLTWSEFLNQPIPAVDQIDWRALAERLRKEEASQPTDPVGSSNEKAS